MLDKLPTLCLLISVAALPVGAEPTRNKVSLDQHRLGEIVPPRQGPVRFVCGFINHGSFITTENGKLTEVEGQHLTIDGESFFPQDHVQLRERLSGFDVFSDDYDQALFVSPNREFFVIYSPAPTGSKFCKKENSRRDAVAVKDRHADRGTARFR